jgi:hypothetical protein
MMQGRDANRKLQRAIKAGKIRDRLPSVIDQLAAALDEWLENEGCPFMYDGQDYRVGQKPLLCIAGALRSQHSRVATLKYSDSVQWPAGLSQRGHA